MRCARDRGDHADPGTRRTGDFLPAGQARAHGAVRGPRVGGGTWCSFIRSARRIACRGTGWGRVVAGGGGGGGSSPRRWTACTSARSGRRRRRWDGRSGALPAWRAAKPGGDQRAGRRRCGGRSSGWRRGGWSRWGAILPMCGTRFAGGAGGGCGGSGWRRSAGCWGYRGSAFGPGQERHLRLAFANVGAGGDRGGWAGPGRGGEARRGGLEAIPAGAGVGPSGVSAPGCVGTLPRWQGPRLAHDGKGRA